ncbi:hypothetical protein FNV43_RR03524 [Rhamnella rubrinervis]|uniref:Dof zinc finger protein n=1 Tax=Rhamnella rubrinervis TaxID=2594499 RepID=A0A8K0HJZ3_9ROSA|nr:hypothetical protein FNV43_RR03524 [Rhamnella rubrinervis]
MLVGTKAQQERKPRPQPEQALKCPRCDSTNTKFCYYNNYSLTQPRYFCKSCRRLQKQSCGQLGYDDHDLSILGNTSTAHCDILGNPSGINTSATNPGFIDAFRTGFLEPHNNFQSMYYGGGYGIGSNMGEIENGGGGVSSEMGLQPYEDQMSSATTAASTVTTMKQELCNGGRENDQTRVLWGFPWQMNNGDHHHGNSNIGDFDSGRECWNGLNSSWHGLLNSPLM